MPYQPKPFPKFCPHTEGNGWCEKCVGSMWEQNENHKVQIVAMQDACDEITGVLRKLKAAVNEWRK